MILGRRDRELFIEAAAALRRQRGSLEEAVRAICQWQDLALESTRQARDLAVAFRIACDRPEVDLRDDIACVIRDLDDQVARLEEMIVA